MKQPVQVNYPRGRINAIGLFFDPNSPFLNSVSSIIIEHWRTGSALYQISDGLILLWPSEQQVFVSTCPGLPLLKQSNIISNTLLARSAVAEFENNRLHFHITFKGQVSRHWVSQCARVPEESLLDLSPWTLVALSPLVNKSTTPKLKNRRVSADVRNVMQEQDLKASPQLTSHLKALKTVKPGSSGNSSAVSTMIAGAMGAVSGLKALFDNKGSSTPSPDSFTQQTPTPGIMKKLKDAISQTIMLSKLGSMIGGQHAKHMKNTLDLFNKGDLTQALKNAVPLGNMRDAMQSSRHAIGNPGSRSHLNINTHQSSFSSSVDLETSLLEKMRQVYEAAFQKLDREGNHQKAAFVLAELLREIDRAVRYLEKNKEFRLAALLAEGQKLSAARVIRQWVLANDIERAIHIAKISGCYEEAITALNQDHPKAANKLRWELALQHAAAGNLLTACELAWPIADKRSETIEWMRQSLACGDPVSAIHLLRLANYDTDNHQAYLQPLHDLVIQEASATNAIRTSVINEILNSGRSHANQIVANLMVRLYLQDVTAGLTEYKPATWKNLLEISENLALRADARNLSIESANPVVPLFHASETILMGFPATQGRSPADVAILSNGWIIVAFGESGVELWTATGKRKNAWFVPCQEIILSDHGNQALLLTHRGNQVSLYKFSLEALQVNFWQDLALDVWAKSYDGLTWMVAKADRLWALDMTSNENTAIWSVNEPGFQVVGIKREANNLGIALRAEARFDIWVYRLPDLFLKERTPHSQRQFSDMSPIDFDSFGNILIQNNDTPNRLCLTKETPGSRWLTLEAESDSASISLQDNWLGYISPSESGSSTLSLVSTHGHQLNHTCLTINCADCSDIRFKTLGHQILVWTENGAIIAVDTRFSNAINQIVV